MTTYEERLDKDVWWAFKEGSMHFEKESAVFKALVHITKRLDELNIPYAVVGGMALFFHGFRRFTEDVDLLVTRDSLKIIHEKLEGLGYLPAFKGSKHLRDTDAGVRVEFLVTGDYPGDGVPKPLAFPDPAKVSVEIEGLRVVSLPCLIELKLASGISNEHRGQDLIDVQRVIDTLDLPEDFVTQLNPYVQDKFKELWGIVQRKRARGAES
jgi:hypothetical protein